MNLFVGLSLANTLAIKGDGSLGHAKFACFILQLKLLQIIFEVCLDFPRLRCSINISHIIHSWCLATFILIICCHSSIS